MSETLRTDVLIIGTGIAGLTNAIKLAESGLEVIIISREEDANITNTAWAQGGIIYSPNTIENKKLLIKDILDASAHTANINAATILAERSGNILEEILIEKAKANFEKDSEHNLKYTKEAAHSMARIIYKGDYTGKTIQEALFSFVKTNKKIKVLNFRQ